MGEHTPAYRLVCGSDWRRVLARLRALKESESVVEGGPTLWGDRHLVRTDGSKVDFSQHPEGTVFWTAAALAKSSPIMQQFKRKDFPITVYDYPARKEQDRWLVAQLAKRGLDVRLAAPLMVMAEYDYSRLHMELDRLALSPESAWQLIPAGQSGQELIDAWNVGDSATMLAALSCIRPQDLYTALSRLVGHAHDIYALQNGHRLRSKWHEMQVKELAGKVPGGWVQATLRYFTVDLVPTHLSAASAVCRLDREKSRAQRKISA